MYKKLIVILIPCLLLAACSEYGKVLKSKDNDYKWQKAEDYYKAGEFDKALTLFDEQIPVRKLTDKAELTYYYFSMCHYHTGQFYLGAYYLKSFSRTFPTSQYAEECHFMSALCNVKNSPNWSLDQAETISAMYELQLFLNRYPNSTRRDTCNLIMESLRNKLETKAYENAYLYYHIEHYRAAVIAFESVLEQYPDTKYREKVMFLIIKSNYLYAINSIEEKKLERYRETVKSYTNFAALYPSSEYKAEAEAIHKDSQAQIKLLEEEEANKKKQAEATKN